MTPQGGVMFPPANSEMAQNAIIRGGCLSAGCGKQGGGLVWALSRHACGLLVRG